jgi:hypothetical protein
MQKFKPERQYKNHVQMKIAQHTKKKTAKQIKHIVL